MQKDFIHHYMPNSVPETKRKMLEALGVREVEDLYRDLIPENLRFSGRMDLPEPLIGEYELKKHVFGILNKNVTCEEYDSFLGAGCYDHYVPAVCDEIASRSEFLTGYCGDTYSDHGKMQAIFEYTSMMGELLDSDVVSYTLYDAGQAFCSSLRMALRIQGSDGHPERNRLLVPGTMNPELFSQAANYVRPAGELVPVRFDEATGLMCIDDLTEKLRSGSAAAVFFENPSYLGFFEKNAAQITGLAHNHGALAIVQPEVASLGIVEPPANYGADLTCGDIQPLGMHMQLGGGCAGFIAGRHEEKYIRQFPTYMYSIAPTGNVGEYGWGRALNYRCSHGSREKANEYCGTGTGLWAITAGVYLSLMGPRGMKELGEDIIQKCDYASGALSRIKNVRSNYFGSLNFQEFVVNFDGCGKTVGEINAALLSRGIFGGKDLSKDFPRLGQSALYCVTEKTDRRQIDRLAAALESIAGGGN